MEIVKFIVTNTFFTNNKEHIINQTTGLPMGTNCAPELANLTLYVIEAAFIDNLLKDGKQDEAMSMQYNFRFIDDCLFWGKEPRCYHDVDGQVIMEYSETTEADGSCIYLGAKIYTKPDQYIQTEVFNKTTAWTNFTVLRYTHADTNAPTHQFKGTVIGQLLRYRAICNSYAAFKTAVTDLITFLLKRKHSTRGIIHGWKKHLQRNFDPTPAKRMQLNSWFHRMLYWATCNCNRTTQPAAATLTQTNSQPPTLNRSISAQQRNAATTSTTTTSTPGPTNNSTQATLNRPASTQQSHTAATSTTTTLTPGPTSNNRTPATLNRPASTQQSHTTATSTTNTLTPGPTSNNRTPATLHRPAFVQQQHLAGTSTTTPTPGPINNRIISRLTRIANNTQLQSSTTTPTAQTPQPTTTRTAPATNTSANKIFAASYFDYSSQGTPSHTQLASSIVSPLQYLAASTTPNVRRPQQNRRIERSLHEQFENIPIQQSSTRPPPAQPAQSSVLTQSSFQHQHTPPDGIFTEDLLMQCITHYYTIPHRTNAEQTQLNLWCNTMKQANHRQPWSNGTPCTKCWMRFHKMSAHIVVKCQAYTTMRADLTTVASTISNSQLFVNTDPNTTDTTDTTADTLNICCIGGIQTHSSHSDELLPLWCSKHHVCTTCIREYHHKHESHSVILSCIKCKTLPQLDCRRAVLFTIQRRTNDSGVMSINSIIDAFQATASGRRTYIEHETDMREIAKQKRKRYKPYTHYELGDLEQALNKQDLTSIIWQESVTEPLPEFIPDCVLAFLVQPNLQHFYTFIRMSNQNNWRIFDSAFGLISKPVFTTIQLQRLIQPYKQYTDFSALRAIVTSTSCHNHIPNRCVSANIFCKSGNHLLCDSCTSATSPIDNNIDLHHCTCNFTNQQ
jgi:hypothetical protein